MSIDRLTAVLIAVGVALSALIEVLFVDHRERLFVGSDIPLFWVGFGLAACIVIIVAAKWVGHSFLMKHEDPYTGEHVEAEPGERPDG
ncbi:MAG: hypothetical protein OXT51_10315 [Chloroflexota bacterium]|nr:hypothetical protein [Chloroflexota bacterium]